MSRSAAAIRHPSSVDLPDGEPWFGPWTVRRIDDLLHEILGAPGPRSAPLLVAVDGRSGGGKTTVTGRIVGRVPGAAVVHTDDIAWYHAMFDWSALMIDGVLAPLRRGEAVAYRPPPWDARARPGAVTVPAGCPLVVVEGVGIGRRDLAGFFDALVWVQTDRAVAWRRGLARDGGSAEQEAFWHEWEAEERPFLAAERPWERADVVVDGAPDLPHDPSRNSSSPSLTTPRASLRRLTWWRAGPQIRWPRWCGRRRRGGLTRSWPHWPRSLRKTSSTRSTSAFRALSGVTTRQSIAASLRFRPHPVDLLELREPDEGLVGRDGRGECSQYGPTRPTHRTSTFPGRRGRTPAEGCDGEQHVADDHGLAVRGWVLRAPVAVEVELVVDAEPRYSSMNARARSARPPPDGHVAAHTAPRRADRVHRAAQHALRSARVPPGPRQEAEVQAERNRSALSAPT